MSLFIRLHREFQFITVTLSKCLQSRKPSFLRITGINEKLAHTGNTELTHKQGTSFLGQTLQLLLKRIQCRIFFARWEAVCSRILKPQSQPEQLSCRNLVDFLTYAIVIRNEGM